MLVLTSNGLSSDLLLNEMRRYLNSGRAALVVTADPVYKEKNYHVDRLTDELRSFGLRVDCFDFDRQSPSELLTFDVVELMGGNPYYLLHSIRKNHFMSTLEIFAQSRCVIGCSAGSMVLSPTIELIDCYSPEMNTVGIEDLAACHFTNVQVLPHYSRFLPRYHDFEEKCRQYERSNHCRVIRLDDGDGVIIRKSRE